VTAQKITRDRRLRAVQEWRHGIRGSKELHRPTRAAARFRGLNQPVMMAMKGRGQLSESRPKQRAIDAKAVRVGRIVPSQAAPDSQTASHQIRKAKNGRHQPAASSQEDAVATSFRSGETVGNDRLPKGGGNVIAIRSPVLHVGPGEQYFKAWLLIVPASLNGRIGRLIGGDVSPFTPMADHKGTASARARPSHAPQDPARLDRSPQQYPRAGRGHAASAGR